MKSCNSHNTSACRFVAMSTQDKQLNVLCRLASDLLSCSVKTHYIALTYKHRKTCIAERTGRVGSDRT